MLKLSIIGCGNVAKTMAFLWHQAGSVEIFDVVNRTQESADRSVGFIGTGKALDSINKLQSADIFVIACGDDQIETCLDELLEQNVIEDGNIVFHFSGAKSANVLAKAKSQGAFCASLHPVKSFADPAIAITTFADTYCGIEGDKTATDVIETLIEAIGGQYFNVDSDKKLTYHSASIFACNYLTALQELSIQALQHSGIERELAMKILEPIVKETTHNIFQLGTAKALTGPIARGDHNLVAAQYNAVQKWDSEAAEIYRLLGKQAVGLSNKKDAAENTNLDKIQKLFE